METNKTTKKDLFMIDPRNIVVVDGFNSRIDFDLEELKNSIRQSGVKNPVSVISFKDENGAEKYRLVDGERRYRACMELLNEGVEIARIPAMFLSKSLKPEDLLIEQCIRNEGKKFSEYEYGLLFLKFKDLGFTTMETVAKLGLAPWKAIYITHTERDPRVQQLMREGKITGAQVRTIYQAHKDDEAGAVNEILGISKKAETKGEKKISLKDLDVDSKTVTVKDSQAIKKGLTLLLKYYNNATADGNDLDLDILDVLDELKKNKTIDVIFDEAVTKYKEAE